MKKRLLLTVFMVILLLTSLGAVFAVETPGGGGTVPDGGYQVWLPVVKYFRLDPYYPYYAVALEPVNGAILYGNTVTFKWDMSEGNADSEGVVISHNSDLSDPVNSYFDNYCCQPREIVLYIEPGIYYWHAEIKGAKNVSGTPSETYRFELRNE